MLLRVAELHIEQAPVTAGGMAAGAGGLREGRRETLRAGIHDPGVNRIDRLEHF